MNQAASTTTLQPAKRRFMERTRVSPQEVMLFCRQLATFVRVGIPITTAINTFAEQSGSTTMRNACLKMAADIEKGALLSEAIAAHPKTFPTLVADMVRAAEVTGNLDTVLRQAAKHIEREVSARQKIRAAMMYPSIVGSLAVVICIGLIAFVLPQFKDLYSSLDVPLPGLVEFLLNVSHFMSVNALVLIALLMILIGVIVYGLTTEGGNGIKDRLLLRLPLVGPMIRAAIAERFCRTLGDMLSAGVPITQAFPVVIDSTRNRVYRAGLKTVAVAMAAGEGFSRPLRNAKLFRPALTQMVAVGEETGSLDVQLHESADLHGDELDYRIKRMTAIVEPALIIGVGLMVGFVAVSMITAIYSLAGSNL